MSECQIVSVHSGAIETRPTIVKFQNGQLQPTYETNLQCAKYFDSKQDKIITTIATNRLAYSGEQNCDDVNTFLAIRNKKTNTVRLVQINSVSLSPQITKLNYMLDTTLNSSSLDVSNLFKQFGSKKTKLHTEQREKMKMDTTNFEDELKEAVQDVIIKDEDLVLPSVEDTEFGARPKINRAALVVDDVYDLKAILLQNELDSLNELAIEVKEKSTIKEQLTPFILYCVNTLKENSVEDIKIYEILLYIDAVLKFFKMPSKIINQKNINIKPYPQIIIEKILKEFTVISDNHRLRPLIMRDKAMCYILVLALIALNYKFELSTLPSSSGVGMRKLIDISRTLGAYHLSVGNKSFIELKLPLATPVKRRSSKK